MIFIDDRESARTIAQAEALFGSTSITTARLDYGDFVFRDRPGCCWMAIERKTASDLISSLAPNEEYPEGRLRRQLTNMEHFFAHSLVVVEGVIQRKANGRIALPGRDSGWTHSAAQAILYDEQRKHSAPFLNTADLAGTLDIVRVLHNRALRGCLTKGSHGLSIVAAAPDLTEVPGVHRL